MKESIEIPLSKKKLGLFLILTVGMILCGISITLHPHSYIPNIFRINNPEVIRLTGIVGLLFFGVGVAFMIKKLFDSRVGLFIDSYGITDNTSAVSIGLIEWDDIVEIRSAKIESTKFLLIYTRDPEKYILKAKTWGQAKLLRANHAMYNTPLSISALTLKIKFSELEDLINSELAKRNMLQKF